MNYHGGGITPIAIMLGLGWGPKGDVIAKVLEGGDEGEGIAGEIVEGGKEGHGIDNKASASGIDKDVTIVILVEEGSVGPGMSNDGMAMGEVLAYFDDGRRGRGARDNC